jgi:hypothetical protein
MIKLKSKDPVKKHQEAIAIKTLRMNAQIGNMLGGPDHEEAIEILKEIGYTEKQINKIKEMP